MYSEEIIDFKSTTLYYIFNAKQTKYNANINRQHRNDKCEFASLGMKNIGAHAAKVMSMTSDRLILVLYV